MGNGLRPHPELDRSIDHRAGEMPSLSIAALAPAVAHPPAGLPASMPLMIDLVAPHLSVDQRAAHEIEAGDQLRLAGDYEAARRHYEQAFNLCPHKGEYRLLLAFCDLAQGRRDSARHHLEQSVRLNPELAQGHEWLSQWYLEEGFIEQALNHSVKAFELAPNDASVSASQAYVLEASGELEAAWELVQRLLSSGYTPPKLVTLYARMAPSHGQMAAALELVDRVLSEGGHSNIGEAGLRFAAAALLDNLGRYDEAFIHTARANELKRPPFDPVAIEREFDQRIEYFTRERVVSLPKATYRSVHPVFIVGMPRAGTSLVEQIISSHPAVHGAGELDLIKHVVLAAIQTFCKTGGHYPQCLDSLSIDTANGLAQLYLEPLASLNRRASFIVDKMPLNFMFLGMIDVLLPGAKIIHCRRNPLDTCLSCYMTNFATANQFSYDLANLGRFYRQYERLMNHWKSVLNLPVLDVDYEKLVADAPSETHRLLDFLGLPWDEHCLRFHETKRAVSTASVEQVRRPIYSSSVGRWRNYEKHLAPLRSALGEDVR